MKNAFFWPDAIKAADEALEHTIECLLACKTEKDREFFRKEYDRISKNRSEMVKDWLEIW